MSFNNSSPEHPLHIGPKPHIQTLCTRSKHVASSPSALLVCLHAAFRAWGYRVSICWFHPAQATRYPLHHQMALVPQALNFPKLRFISNALRHRTVWSKLSPSLYACGCIYTRMPRITVELLWLLHQGTWTAYVGAEPPVMVTALFFNIYKNTPDCCQSAIISAMAFLLPSAPHLTWWCDTSTDKMFGGWQRLKSEEVSNRAASQQLGSYFREDGAERMAASIWLCA